MKNGKVRDTEKQREWSKQTEKVQSREEYSYLSQKINKSLPQSENNTVVIYGGGRCAKSHMITIRSEAELTLNQLK